MAHIVAVCEFVNKKSLKNLQALTGKKVKSFKGFVDYSDRESAKSKEEVKDYINYMDRSSASDLKNETNLFDFWTDNISSNRKETYKNIYNNSFEKNGNMWIQVVTFENDYLINNGVLTIDGVLDDTALKHYIRQAMTKQLKSLNMLSNVAWTGAIHYNTDNIHVHLSFVTKNMKNNTSEQRGKIPLSIIEKLKSDIANQINDRSVERKELTKLRQKLASKRITNTEVKNINKYKSFFKEMAIANIKNKQYARLTTEQKELIDSQVDSLLHNIYEKEYKIYLKTLNEEQDFIIDTYGGDGKGYSENQIKDLKIRMANKLLKDFSEYKDINNYSNYSMTESQTFKNKQSKANSLKNAKLNQIMNKFILKMMRESVKEMKTKIREFDNSFIKDEEENINE